MVGQFFLFFFFSLFVSGLVDVDEWTCCRSRTSRAMTKSLSPANLAMKGDHTALI